MPQQLINPRDEHQDLVSDFILDMEGYGKSESTLYEYERVLRDFEDGIESPPADASRRNCMAYISGLRKRDLSSSSIATYASYIHRFYSYLVKAEDYPVTHNPMALVMEEIEESIEKHPRRRELSVQDVSDFIKSVNHPRDRCMILMLFKTGIRAGELANLDLNHISLGATNPSSFELGDNGYLEPRSLLVESDLKGNKRKRDTLIPIDDELEKELGRWLRVRPNVDTDALFISLSPSSSGRLSSDSIARTMRRYTEDYGWWNEDADLTHNVTPHYCRHFFTTYLRKHSGDDGFVKYLRGDTGGDIIETYTHQWGDDVREKYEKHIYKLINR